MDCGYCLFGITAGKCPECGSSLVGLRARDCQIPWEHRRERGWIRSYWQTVWVVTFQNRRFCEEYARPVRYKDARIFQLITLLHFYLPTVVGVVLLYLANPAKLPSPNSFLQIIATGLTWTVPPLWDRIYAEVWPAPIALTCFLIFLIAATGAPSYFFHPKGTSIRRQNTTIAMSYYACGILSLGPIIAAAGLLAGDRSDIDGWSSAVGLFVAVSSAAIVTLLWWLNLVNMARLTMPQIKGRYALVIVGVPLVWLGLVALTLIALPAVAVSILVVGYSLL